ncbi:metal-dependent hydrolase family protein [Novosphingobium mangrovi (ex Huang et al. 2023)]|uniref:Amidohydrolase family protein n=1 Tax=Novosphingobium mangrovi (ex Huang et al. 2023) TaxID=2976432 RepID=A0ABT2I6S3_9SPHN|nr:amidohydrolase family protein [Novosphingobium mangrovi (ex Huang et al. 2023)]MCT2400516.1 amidohydrolase family protein [Novosphingobium mangrovi (ex Huang et al. 2023)]
MGRTLIQNATIFTATGADAFKGDLVVEGNRIVSVGAGASAQGADEVIDASGMFCMPGMTEGHAHLSFENVGATEDLITPSPETQVFTAARGAKALLEAGFTSAYGASEAKLKLAVAVREEVNASRLPGPRIRAGGLEISVTGAMGDESTAHNPRIGPSTIVDGVEEMRKAVRTHCREGIDNIKLDVSGDPFYPNTPGHTTPMTFDEIRVAAETAHAYGRKINAHTRSIEGSKYCVRAGVDGLFHTEYSDEELLDMMEEAKDRIFVVPTVGLFAQIMAGEAGAFGLSPEVGGYMNIPELLENSIRTHTELRKRGVRHLIGGDYGFCWSPQGTQGRDLKSFVDLYGYSPAEALICATRNGGLAMGYNGELGTLEAGKLADLILVDGDPLADISVLSGPEKVALVMKDGAIQKISPALAANQKTPALEAAE